MYLDGEHHIDIVKKEFQWFKERLVDGGVIVIDNINYIFPHMGADKDPVLGVELNTYILNNKTYNLTDDIISSFGEMMVLSDSDNIHYKKTI